MQATVGQYVALDVPDELTVTHTETTTMTRTTEDDALPPAVADLIDRGRHGLETRRAAQARQRGEVSSQVMAAVADRLRQEPGFDPSLLPNLSVSAVDYAACVATAQLDLPGCVPVLIGATNRISSETWRVMNGFRVLTTESAEPVSFTTLAVAVAAAREAYLAVAEAGAKPGGGHFTREELARGAAESESLEQAALIGASEGFRAPPSPRLSQYPRPTADVAILDSRTGRKMDTGLAPDLDGEAEARRAAEEATRLDPPES